MAASISIAILANAKQAKQELGGVSSSFKKFGAVAAAGVAVAGAAALKFGADAVKSASDAQQSLGATETVFGKYAGGVIANSKKAAKAVGLSANEYRELANVTGALLAGSGMPLKKVAGLTDDLNKRAADMAATFGGTTSEAVQAISSLMKGEADPIEKYGVSIKQSDVNARLAAKGLSGLTGEAKKQAEQQARLDLLMQKTVKTQGAFKRESNTLAHQQQVLGAQFENLKAKVGTALLPVLTKVFGYVNNTVLPALERWGGAMRDNLAPHVDKVKEGVSRLWEKLRPLGDWFKENPEVVKGVGVALGIAAVAAGLFAAAMGVVAVATSPITGVVLAVAAVGGAVAYAYKHSETFRNGVQALGAKLKEFGGWATSTLMPALKALGEAIAARLKPIFESLAQTWETKVKPAVQKLLAKFKEWWPTIQKVVGVVGRLYGGWLKFQAAILGKVLPVVIKLAGFLIGKLVGVIGTVIGWVVKIIAKVIDFGGALVKAVKKAGEFVSGLKQKFGNALDYVRGIPQKITGALGNLGSLLSNAGRQVIEGFWNGLKEKWADVENWFHTVTDKIPDLKGPAKKDKRLLTKNGILIMGGLMDGLQQGWSGTKKWLQAVTKTIQDLAPKKAKQVLKGLKYEFAALKRNAKAQDKINKKLEAGRKAYEDLKTTAKDYAASIASNTKQFLSLGNLNSAFNSTSMLEQMRARLQKQKDYNALIQDLISKGLNEDMAAELAAGGVEGGLAYAQAIAAGGPAAIAEFNALQKQANAAATQLGDMASKDMYAAGIDAAAALVAGLESQAAALDKAASRIARKISKAIRAALGLGGGGKKKGGKGKGRQGAALLGRISLDLDETYAKRSGAVLGASLNKTLKAPQKSVLNAHKPSQAAVPQTLTINVNVPPTADKAAIGREVENALNAYRKKTGKAAL